jgi:hypothetical protein
MTELRLPPIPPRFTAAGETGLVGLGTDAAFLPEPSPSKGNLRTFIRGFIDKQDFSPVFALKLFVCIQ